jgi:beta-glucosidase
MIEATHYFPKAFLWGTSTSAHQVEGGNTMNDWWEWEQQPGTIVKGHTSATACDWWGGRWKEDLDRAADSGQNAHRLSVEWSRIAPEAERWDDDALDYYRELTQGVLERDMKPLITLHHFTNPLWIAGIGGWENPETVTHFESFVRRVVSALKDDVRLWITINEPNVYVYSAYLAGVFPPGKKDLGKALLVSQHLIEAHAAAYHAIHEIQSNSLVGMAHYYRGMRPSNPRNPLDRLVTRIRSSTFNENFPRAAQDGLLRMFGRRIRIPQAARTQDFFGLDYYTSEQVRFDLTNPRELFGQGFFPEDADLSGTGFIANDPEGMWGALKFAHSFGLPIIVAENGVEDGSDRMRPRYLAQHLRKVWSAVNFNWPVLGYFHWTLVDNFEWERGWTQRFGLWGLDEGTQERHKRASAEFYSEICKLNGFSSQMVAKYAPETFDEMFPRRIPAELVAP